MADKQVLSTGDVAALFGVSRTTVARWSEQGLLVPSFTTPTGQRKYHAAAIHAALAAARQPAALDAVS